MLQRLNPADHFTLMMDHEIRNSGLSGNFCAVALELGGIPDSGVLEQRCRDFPRRFPRSIARLQQRGRQYVWQLRHSGSIPFCLHDLFEEDPGASKQRLVHILNRAMPASEAAPVELHLIRHREKSLLALKWFHPACDAKGAELVLHHLFQEDTEEDAGQASVLDRLFQQWSLWQKIKLGFRAKKNIDRLDRNSSVLPVDMEVSTAQALAVRVEQFDMEQSAQILMHARRQTGLTGTALYFIGCMMRSLEQTGCPDAGEAYLVPYAVNLRRSRSVYPVFGNQVSFLFVQAERETVHSRERLFAHLKEQNRDSVKQRLDQAMLPLMKLASWQTLEKHGNIVRRTGRGRERSSFWFSYTGRMEPEPEGVVGCPIQTMYQISQVTAPPSIALLVNNFQGRVVLSLNYVRNQFSPEWIETLLKTMGRELLWHEGKA